MPRIRFVQPDGAVDEVEAPVGVSVMKAAIGNDVAGIVAECGGSCMCATCHVYVDPADVGRLPEAAEEESDMLDYTAAGRQETSRLSCQITVTADLDGLTVRVPGAQT